MGRHFPFLTLLFNGLDYRCRLTFSFRSFLGRSLRSFLSSAAQRNLSEEEYGNGTNYDDHHDYEEDIMDTCRQADLHGLNDLIEHRHCRSTLMRGLRQELRLYIWLEQDLRVVEDSQELRHLGLHCRESFDRGWERVVKRGQIGRLQY